MSWNHFCLSKLEKLIPETVILLFVIKSLVKGFFLSQYLCLHNPLSEMSQCPLWCNLGIAESNETYKWRGFREDSGGFWKQSYLYHLLLGSRYVITLLGRQPYTAAGWNWFLESWFIRSIIHHTETAKTSGYTVTSQQTYWNKDSEALVSWVWISSCLKCFCVKVLLMVLVVMVLYWSLTWFAIANNFLDQEGLFSAYCC